MSWTHYICEIKGRLALVLVDKQFVGCEPRNALPKVFWVCVYTRLPPMGPFWHPDETDELDKLEDHFIDLFREKARGQAAYVLRIATTGIREYFIYHSTEINLASTHAALCSAYPEYKIVFECLEDPTWREYTTYATFKPATRIQRLIGYLKSYAGWSKS